MTTEGLLENGTKTVGCRSENRGLLGNGAKKYDRLPKPKLPSFKNIAKSVIVEKNNKQLWKSTEIF